MVDGTLSGMEPQDQPRSEREHTDESLRLERDTADRALEEEVAAVDETADAVVSRARARADELLTAARAKTDRQVARAAPGAPLDTMTGRERAREDQTLREERATADQTLRDERSERLAGFSQAREETDKNLFTERARSDSALATRDDFLGIVSHDLRNMLNTVVGSAALIADRVSREDPVQEVRVHARRIQRAGARMNRLIGDLVDVVSLDAGKLAVALEVGDTTSIVTEVVDTFQAHAAQNEVSLSVEIGSPPFLAEFDPARILQVLTNLLSNAIKFTPAHGKVVVHLARVGDDIRFAVSDSGVGLPSGQLEAVFERFVQVARKDRRGAGLGLYISRGIVQAHGGRIWAESRVGEGSTFYFTLPADVSTRGRATR
jgi:signal transduction histidine kinase